MEEKKKSNTSWIVLVCLIVAVVVCCVFLFAKQLTKNTTPKSMFINGIENMFKQEKGVKEFDTVKADVKLSANVKTNLLDKDVLDLINKLSLRVKADVDMKNQYGTVAIDTKYDNDQVIDAKAYYEEKVLYVFLNDIFDKWVKVDMSSMDLGTLEVPTESFDIDLDSANELATEVKNALLDSFKDNYFSKDKEDDLTKITLTINKDNALDIVKEFVKNLKNSKKFKDVAKELTGTDMDTLLDQAEEALKQVDKSAFASLEDVKVTMYLDKDNNATKITVDTSVQGTPVKLEMEKDDNNFSLAVYAMGIKAAELSVKNKDDKCTIYVNVISMLEATINIEGTIKYDEKIEKADVSKSVKVDEITEAEAETIMGKIMGSKGLNKLMTAIEKVMPQTSYDLDSDYDYDFDLDSDYDFNY